ncbi:conserved hypothetical protein [Sphingomonas aurantiaca]|uniref:Uncharacterized protein n=1 Tax=Sphingomonas aurantiaca TaxID=185949 RepID=A0A5E7ZEX3_9SPHN|nr:conserved hypothetical protein [Sphingomonas aurantiaca]
MARRCRATGMAPRGRAFPGPLRIGPERGRGPPKEQPPRNLSGTRDRAGLIDTLESVLASAPRATEGVSRQSGGESSQVP